MPSTGLYFLPHSSAEDFLARLKATYKVTPLQRWTLEHRIFRETPKAASTDRTSVKYLQVLTLSYEPGFSYIAITNTPNNTTAAASSISLPSSQQQAVPPSTADIRSSIDNGGEAAATIASIASGQATDEFVQFIVTKLTPLWMVLKMVSVGNGLTYEVGDFRIRVGELRQGLGSLQTLRGIVVEINWAGGGGAGAEDSDHMDEEVEWVIKGFWEPLGVTGAKEVFQVAGFAEGNGTVRQWLEMLRLRG